MAAWRRFRFSHAALVASVLFLGYAISRYDWCFQDAEVSADFLPAAVHYGPAPAIRDAALAFDTAGLDGDSRPRLVSYLAFVISTKTRLALWHVVPPHPSLSPIWLLTLGLGPLLFRRFLRLTLGDDDAVRIGLAAYLASVGLLSSVTMTFHPAKPLSIVLTIAVLYACARVKATSGRIGWTFACLLFIAPFVDEAAIFVWAIPLVWLPSHFWPVRGCGRNWAFVLTPMALAGFVLLRGLTMLERAAGRPFDFVDYLSRLAEWTRLDLGHVVWQAANLISPVLMPWRLAGAFTPVSDGPAPQLLALAVIVVVAMASAIAIRRRRQHWTPFLKLTVLTAIFVVVIAFSCVFHELDLATTGFYYGAPVSVLTSSLIALGFADAQRRSRAARWIAGAAVAWMLAMSMMNFVTLNAMWREHSNRVALSLVGRMPLASAGFDTTPVTRFALESHSTNDPVIAAGYYAADPTTGAAAPPGTDAFDIWRRWHQGGFVALRGRPVTLRNLWLLEELALSERRR